jgi:hypothetical protein
VSLNLFGSERKSLPRQSSFFLKLRDTYEKGDPTKTESEPLRTIPNQYGMGVATAAKLVEAIGCYRATLYGRSTPRMPLEKKSRDIIVLLLE